MKVYAATDIGRVRPTNEDSFLAPEPGERFCAVADGMGGHNAGEVASAMAVEILAETMRQSDAPADEALLQAAEKANLKIYQAAMADRAKSGMGTTLTALAFDKGAAHIAHVGDSRCYLLRDGAILRLTTDHTLVEEMVLSGLITPSAARVHPKRNYITRALGTAETVEADILHVELKKGDVFFLCTDGVSNHVTEQELLDIFKTGMLYNDKVNTILEIALRHGGTDNITAMIVTCEEDTQ